MVFLSQSNPSTLVFSGLRVRGPPRFHNIHEKPSKFNIIQRKSFMDLSKSGIERENFRKTVCTCPPGVGLSAGEVSERTNR